MPPLELQHSTIDERGFLSTKYLSGSDELSREICLKGADQSTAFDVVRTTLGSIASAPKAESITFLMFKFRFEKEQALFKGAQPFDQTSGQDEELEYSLKDNLEDGDDDSQSDEGNDEYEEEEEPGDILEDSLEDEPNDELPGDPEEDTVLGRILPEDDTVLGRIVERFSIRISVGSDRTGKSDIELDRDSFREGNHGDGFISEDDSDDEIGEDSDNIRRKVPYDRYDERSASDVKAAIRKLSREVNIFGGDLSCALAKDCKAELEWEWYEGDDRCYERRNIVSYADDD